MAARKSNKNRPHEVHRTDGAPLAAIADGLLARFSRRRPLRAGSLIVTLFGDSIAARGNEVALAALIAVLAPFGITDRLARTAIGRLAQGDWLQPRRFGRSSFYRLTPAGEERFAEATARIYGTPRDDWRGEWTLVILPSALAARPREAARKELAWMGFGQVSQSTFAHPETAALDVQCHWQRLKFNADPLILSTHSTGIDADRRLVELGWELSELARRYRRFVQVFEPALSAFDTGAECAPRDCFHLRTLLIHEYRRVHLRDPLLPASLLPPDWAGTSAYELCRALYLRLAGGSDEYLRQHMFASGALPRPTAAYSQRFAAC